MEYDAVVIPWASDIVSGGRDKQHQLLTLHSQSQKIPTCLGCFLSQHDVSSFLPFTAFPESGTLDHNSISISPAVVSTMTLPLVGSAMRCDG